MKKLISIVLASMLVLMATVPAFAAENEGLSLSSSYDSAEEWNIKTCIPTLDDIFDDNCIVVEFTNEESLKFKDYTPADFPGIDVVSVTCGIDEDADNLKKQLDAEKNGEEYTGKYIDPTTYIKKVGLELKTRSKQHVIDVVNMLRQEHRSDILYVYPSYLMPAHDGQVDSEESTQSTTKSPATADTATKNNNANGSIPTGQNSILIYTMLVALVSAVAVAVLVKRKKS